MADQYGDKQSALINALMDKTQPAVDSVSRYANALIDAGSTIGNNAIDLAKNPSQYLQKRWAEMEQEAKFHNQMLGLSLQAMKAENKGIALTPEQSAAKKYSDQKLEEIALGFSGAIKPIGKIGQSAVTENIRALAENPTNFSDFTYLLSNRQRDVLSKKQSARGGELPEKYAIEVTQQNALHPVESRSLKDNMTRTQIADLLDGVYQTNNQIGLHPNDPRRFYLVNTNSTIMGNQRPAGLFTIEGGKISPATAYPATDAKVNWLTKVKK